MASRQRERETQEVQEAQEHVLAEEEEASSGPISIDKLEVCYSIVWAHND